MWLPKVVSVDWFRWKNLIAAGFLKHFYNYSLFKPVSGGQKTWIYRMELAWPKRNGGLQDGPLVVEAHYKWPYNWLTEVIYPFFCVEVYLQLVGAHLVLSLLSEKPHPWSLRAKKVPANIDVYRRLNRSFPFQKIICHVGFLCFHWPVAFLTILLKYLTPALWASLSDSQSSRLSVHCCFSFKLCSTRLGPTFSSSSSSLCHTTSCRTWKGTDFFSG